AAEPARRDQRGRRGDGCILWEAPQTTKLPRHRTDRGHTVMRLLLLLLAAAALPAPAPPRIDTDKELLDLFRLRTAPGVYELLPRTYKKPGTATFGSDGGNLSGTAEQPIVIRGAGMGLTTIECPLVCYFSTNEHVVFEDLTIHGAI